MDDLTIQQRQQALVDLMKKNGSLKSSAVERAFMAIPRHIFLPNDPLERVYSDIAIAVRKIGENEWTSSSSQPTMMAIMLEQLDLSPGHKVLEIGTGSGFNAALMAEIVGPQGRVVTVDIQPDLIAEAREKLDALGYHWVQTNPGDGGYGFPEGAPYDRVILTVGSEIIAPAWREQLIEGGKLVLPLTIGKIQKSIAFERQGDVLVSANASDCGFMRLQGAFAEEEPVKTQIGPDPELSIISDQPPPVNGVQIESWLSSPSTPIPSGVKVKESEAWGSITTWLTLQKIDFGILLAEDDQAQRQDVPVVFYMGRGSDYRVKQSMILVETQAAAAITRPPGEPVPFFDWNSPIDEDEHPRNPPFELYVLQLGPDAGPANRLLTAIRSWEELGRPGAETMHIRAIPADQPYQAAQGEYLIEKPWTNLLISFSK